MIIKETILDNQTNSYEIEPIWVNDSMTFDEMVERCKMIDLESWLGPKEKEKDTSNDKTREMQEKNQEEMDREEE